MILNASYTTILNTAIADVTSVLTTFASDPLFVEKFALAFGTTISSEQFLQNVAVLPKIEVRSDAELKGALGAFSAQTQKIYLSESLLKGDLVRLRSVLIEEIGHFVDAQVNNSDSPGDEGAIFAALVQGQSLDAVTLQALKAEDDSAIITIAGENILVEQSTVSFAFSRANFQVSEDGKALVPVTINRTGGSDGNASVVVSLADGTATSNQDYIVQTFTVNFNAGETTKTVIIPIINDIVAESSKTINLTLSNPVNGTIGNQSTATLTIIDNDKVWAGYADVVLDYFDAGTGPIPGPYGFINNGNSGTIPINLDAALGDEPSSGANAVTLPTGSFITLGFIDETIIDGPGNDIFVREDGAAGDRANVFISSNLIDFTFLGVAQDNITTAFDLSSINYTQPVRAVKVIGLNLAGSVPGFDLVNVQALNRGSATGKLAFDSAKFFIDEDGTKIAAVTVIRTDGSYGAVSAKINFKDGTAKAPGDYTNAAITVSFAAGETSKTVNIPIINDTTPELDETIQLILTNPTGGATIGTQNTATLTIVDNDSSLLITGLPQGSTGSNKGQVTIVIAGQNFSPTDEISLISPTGTAKAASKVYWVNETEAWATFDLQGLATGAYDVKVVNGSNSAILNDRFSVTDGPLGNLNVQFSYPSQGVVTLNYSNAGQTDLNAPLLRIVPTNAAITYSDTGTTSAALKQLLNLVAATGNNSPSGILSPGESGEISFAFTPNGNGLISFAVEQVKPDEVINWASIKAESRADYSFIDSAAWDAIWTNLTASLGTTVGQFQTVMAENANYLSQLGQETNDLRRLFAFEWKQAVNTLTNVDLISTTDVVDAAPGLSLTFNRTFYQSLAERYNLGSLGRGWASQWDLRATTNSQGDVVIRSVGDLQRLFEKQTDGTFLEDGGAKVTITNGQYTLKESNGLVFFFGTDGKLNYVQETNANRITLQYTNSQLTKLVHTNGDSLTLTYNSQGRINKITDTAGQATTYSYDSTGEHLLSATGVDGTITYSYDTGTVAAKKHSLLSVTSDLGYQRSFEYDNQGRLTKESSNGNTQALTYSYDTVGGVTITDSTGASQTVLLDDRGNGGQIRGVNNQNLLFSYDADGNLIDATLPNGNQPGYSYDANGNLTQQTNLLGQNTNFTYDATFQQLAGFTDPKGNGVGYSYDAKGNLNKITYGDGSTQQFTIDASGNVTSYINRRGSTIGYTYNTSGLLTKKQYADGSSITYGYDAKANLTSVVDGTGTTTMLYDAANRMTKITYPTGRSLTYTYNADGQRTKLVSSDGYTTNYSYDTVGRLKTLTNATGQTIISYDYDSAGRLTKETNGNGTYTTYQYDLQDQLTSLVNYKANNTVNSKFDYAYDTLGRRTTMTTLEGVFKYGYDAIGQLTSVVTPTNRTINYTYDAAGNRVGVTDSSTTTNYTSNNLNQYTNVGNALYTYDSDGNLISKTEGSQTSTYTYDAESRLVKVVTPSGTWDYQYDGLGNRVATILNGQRTEYLLDPTGLGDIVGEYSGSTLVANYTHGLGLVSRVNGSNSNYYDADAIGSTVGLTATDGSYVNRYSYLPFGEDLTKVEGVANPFEYVGQWGVMDEGNGLDFMRARFYDTGLGRFTSVDPLNLAGGTSNLYSYTVNQPTNAIDPTGEFAWILGGAAIGATVNTVVYAATNYGNYSPGGWAGAVASGAISGGLTASGLGVGVIAGMASGAASNAIGYGVQSAIDGKWNTKDFLAQTAIGGVTGIIPGTIGYKGQGASAIGSKYLFKPQSLAGYLRQFGKTVFGQNKTGLALWKGLGAGSIAGGILSSGYETLKGATLKGKSWNDPHLKTLDGSGYGFQTVGEFTLVKSTTDDFEIQTRQQPWGSSNRASANTAIAIKAGGQRIALYANQTNPLLINGTAVTLPEGGLYAVGQNLITRSGNQYSIFTANNDLILVKNNGTWLNINLGLADNRKGKVVGLLGNFNDNRNDEFALRDGTVIGGAISDTRLYGDYAASWRIIQANSLFTYATGESTTTFTDLTFPRNIVTTASLTAAQRAAAEQIARNAGITDPDVLEDVILDIFLSNGDTTFIQEAINGATDQQRIETVNAPNTLINPDGLGTQHFLTTSAVIPYAIRFSNNAVAGTIPVAQVTITQTLDADLDLNTFTLDDITFGAITVNVPNGSQNFSQRLDLRSTRNVFVDVNASLNTTTRVVTWTFTAIDPATGNTANSTTQGFLPPNDANGAGRGFVGYSIQSKASSTTNTRIDAQASITFNSQTPILTNPVFNTLDGNAPTSQVTALPANSNASFTVAWSGSDTGSGLASYDIYVSTDNGAYTLWQDDITATSATYNGQTGKTYRFYSTGTDNLGLTETAPTQPDATTTVGTVNVGVIAFSTANYTLNEDGTTSAAITLTRTGGSSGAVGVTVTPSGGTALATTDFNSAAIAVNFANGETSKIVTILIVNDTINELDETFNLTLSNPTGGATLGTQKTATVAIIDNDPLPVISLIANQTVIEGLTSPQNVVYTVTLSNPSSRTITVQYATANGTALAGSDYTSVIGTLTFNPGVTSQTITIPILNDSINEADETFTLTLTNPTNAALGTSIVTTTITDTLTASTTTTLPVNVENLILTGTAAINGTGNAGDNTLTGNSASNTLDGGAGNDSLKGGAGNDIYLVDSVRDVVVENLGEGVDTVQSAVNNTLTDNVENLTLTGTANINGTGNALDNVITGNSGNNLLKGMNGNDSLLGGTGNDVLVGGAGNDRLTGGDGTDQFLFGSGAVFAQTQFGTDTITDFLKGTDKLVLSKLSFNVLTSAIGGNLLATEFATINTTTNELALAGSSTAKIVYNSGTGNLFYNQNLATSGVGTGGLFASLTGTPNLGINDFLIQS